MVPPLLSSNVLLDALFGKTKQAVITRLFSDPHRTWHLRELARAAGVSATMLAKEISTLAKAGLVIAEKDGNRLSIKADPTCLLFAELKSIAAKTAGIFEVLKKALRPLAGIEFAFVFGSIARGEERAGSDVDLCVIGSMSNRSITQALAPVEEEIGRVVSPVVYNLGEFKEKFDAQNHFVKSLLAAQLVFLIGDEDELKRTVGPL